MFTELVRLGKDAELKSTSSGDLLSVTAAYDFGYGDKKKTQWIGLTLFGNRAAKVAGSLTKGTLIMATMDEVHVDEWQGKSYLKAKLIDFKFAGGKKEGGYHQQQPVQRQPQGQPKGFSVSSEYPDDDLPF